MARSRSTICAITRSRRAAILNHPNRFPGVTGERNQLALRGRGVFACIAPWNFPLSIFTGQIAAALAAGNTVLAKPAEQTPLIARCGRPAVCTKPACRATCCIFCRAMARASGKSCCPTRGIAGVAFTGSTETAAVINRELAAREGAIPVFIAETGGLNAMIVDSTALPEQVARDVIVSAFNSAGQRCSSLRILFLQEDIADRMMDQIIGATDELLIGDPFDTLPPISARSSTKRPATRSPLMPSAWRRRRNCCADLPLDPDWRMACSSRRIFLKSHHWTC